jgi:hypothetical protein
MTRRLGTVAAALSALVLLAGCGRGQEQPPVQQPAANNEPAAQAAGGHDHGGTAVAGPSDAEAAAQSTSVKGKRTWTDKRGNHFTIWISFGPAVTNGATMCAVAGPSGYARSLQILIQSDKKNSYGTGPWIGVKDKAIAFPVGEYQCSWWASGSERAHFKPGEARTFTGLVEKTRTPLSDQIELIIGNPAKPKQLIKLPYRSILK